jgi:hypothetical protein
MRFCIGSIEFRVLCVHEDPVDIIQAPPEIISCIVLTHEISEPYSSQGKLDLSQQLESEQMCLFLQ